MDVYIRGHDVVATLFFYYALFLEHYHADQMGSLYRNITAQDGILWIKSNAE